MRDTITWYELDSAYMAEGVSRESAERLTKMVKTVQGLSTNEEAKLCKNLVAEDTGKEVFLNDRQLSGILYDFNEEGDTFWLAIDFKIHKFSKGSIIVLRKTFKGADTLIDG